MMTGGVAELNRVEEQGLSLCARLRSSPCLLHPHGRAGGTRLAGEGAPCCRHAALGTQLLRGGAPDPTFPAAIYQKLKITQE